MPPKPNFWLVDIYLKSNPDRPRTIGVSAHQDEEGAIRCALRSLRLTKQHPDVERIEAFRRVDHPRLADTAKGPPPIPGVSRMSQMDRDTGGEA